MARRNLWLPLVVVGTTVLLTAGLLVRSLFLGLGGVIIIMGGVAFRLLLNCEPADTLPVEALVDSTDDTTRILLGLDGALRGRCFRLTDKLIIGRSLSRCSVVFPENTPGVSAVHCTLRFSGTCVTVTDENSSYGTYVDGARLVPGHARIIHRGQIIELGSDQQTLMLR